ncbi:hypothetical protein BD414DRAFT_540053 [Trametes punicea]|nr:hypothetical protein BD414DRAFT_540053 [Trametes punicea]
MQKSMQDYLANTTWPTLINASTSSEEQNKTSLLEWSVYHKFNEVQCVDTNQIPLLQEQALQQKVNEGLARVDYTATVALFWGIIPEWVAYRTESELATRLYDCFRAISAGIPQDTNDKQIWPPPIADAPYWRLGATYKYEGVQPGIEYDVALYLRTRSTLEGGVIEDYPYFLIKGKTEPAISAKLRDVENHMLNCMMPEVTQAMLNPADHMLLQIYTQLYNAECPVGLLMGDNTVYVVERRADKLFIDGPRYRRPEPGQVPFTPLDAARLVFTAYYARADQAMQRFTAPLSALSTPAQFQILRVLPNSWHPIALRRMWEEIRLVTCTTLRVRFPTGYVTEYTRDAGPLSGPIVSSSFWRVIQLGAQCLPPVANVSLDKLLGGGGYTMAWRATLGATSIVLKMDTFIPESLDDRRVLDEWVRLSQRLPQDARAATQLPIPAYHGLFSNNTTSVIVMSDCGESLQERDLIEESLKEAQARALEALRNVGIDPQDVAPRNTVWDGQKVRIIDFV